MKRFSKFRPTWTTWIFNDRGSTRSSFDFSTNSLETVSRYNRETLQDFNLDRRFGSGIPFGIEVTIYSNLALKSRAQISPFVSSVDNTRKSFAVSDGVLRLNIRLYREARRKNVSNVSSLTNPTQRIHRKARERFLNERGFLDVFCRDVKSSASEEGLLYGLLK